MFAFLRQAPDIQKVIVSIFSNGDLWLDTTMILPLLAETLLDDPSERHYTVLVRAMRDAGLRLFVTDGVIEETQAHLNLSLNCARTISSAWKSRVPFVLSAYFLSGRARSAFVDWLERFMGDFRPIEDLREYLSITHGIEERSLAESAASASAELRAAVQEIFLEAHERRRKALSDEEEMDQATLLKLVAHDVENVVGIMQLRRQAAANPLGYRAWWLTLDKTANNLRAALKDRVSGNVPASPAMAPDFMAQYLRLGPLRTAIDRELWLGLPIVTDVTRISSLPVELIAKADEIRRRHTGLDEDVLRRRVRDELDQLKMRRGPESLLGIAGMRERLGGSIEDQRRRQKGKGK
jgi:hypothetical protein